MDPTLRPAKLSDLSVLKNLQKKLEIHERPFDPRIPKRGVAGYYDIDGLIEDNNVNFLVAEIKNKIVGCGFGQIRKDDDLAANKNFGHIGLMFIDEKFRGQSIGKLIVGALVKWFKEKGIHDIRLKVYEKNVSAVNAYRKYGFKNFILEMRYAPD